jgi:hypothetical protein
LALAALLMGVVVSFGTPVSMRQSTPPRPAASGHCDRFASPSGSNRWPGTEARPFRTVARLAARLRAGETGCLLQGATFAENVTIRRGGTPGRPITLTSSGRPAATIRGRLVVSDGANHLVVSHLVLDGRNARNDPSPTVNGDDVLFDHDEVTNHHTAICFVLGSRHYGKAVDVVIRATAVHDCGTLPANNHEHGIYVEWADRTVITGNAITRNADRGVQLFPDAQHTVVTHNLIAGNGEGLILSGDDESASSDNLVAYNVITDSTIRYDVEEWWPGPVGERNEVIFNCVGGPTSIQDPARGFVAENNVVLPRGLATMSLPGGYCGLPPGLRPGPAQPSG